MPQTLSDIKALLAAYGLHPKKKFGQNFLHDHNHLLRIVEAADVQPGERIVEVGPGTGTLSETLLDAGAQLVVVEVDTDLQPILEARLGDRVTFIFDDVLAGKHALNPALLDAVRDEPFKLVANLPYQVASPLLVNLLVQTPAMSRAVVMVQREVAQRIMAPPGNKDYGPLSVMVQATCLVRRVGVLSPTCFWPAPQVESAVICLDRRPGVAVDLKKLSQLLHTLFSKRRKQLGAILGRDAALPPGVTPQQRPEELSVEQLVALAG